MALAPLAPATRNLVDGKLVEASDGGRFENLDPATEAVLGTAPDGTRDDMEAALDAARRAFDAGDWAADPARRARCLTQLHDALREELTRIRHKHGYAILYDCHSIRSQIPFLFDGRPDVPLHEEAPPSPDGGASSKPLLPYRFFHAGPGVANGSDFPTRRRKPASPRRSSRSRRRSHR